MTLNALVKRSSAQGPPPQTIEFIRKRYQNQTAGQADGGQVIGHLDSNVGPTNTILWQYWSFAPQYSDDIPRAGWDITTLRGRWQISVKFNGINQIPDQKPAYFKVDKRDQIVKFAQTWLEANEDQVDTGSSGVIPSTGTGYCGGFTSMIYEYLDLLKPGTSSIPTPMYDQQNYMSITDAGDGAILFYRTNKAAKQGGAWDPAHSAIKSSQSSRININSNTKPLPLFPVTHEGILDGVQPIPNPTTSIEEGRYFDIRNKSSVNLDED